MSIALDRLPELQAQALPRCTPADVGLHLVGNPEWEEGSREYVQDMNDWLELERYFAHFLPPTAECPCCAARLGGLLSAFEWTIVHGEGRCGRCGWPCTAYHRPKSESGEEILFLNAILAAHPSEVSRR